MLFANLYVSLRLHVINLMINIETEESEIVNWLKQSQNYVTMDYEELNYHFPSIQDSILVSRQFRKKKKKNTFKNVNNFVD